MLLISENLGISPGQKGLFNEKWGAHTKLNLKALLFV
jgi:hypothetical protein